jgi:PilZ domain
MGSQAAGETLRISYLTDRALGKGRILALSRSGCVVEGDVLLTVGCWVHLFFPEFPGKDAAFSISWAIVRLTEGNRFTADFLSMPESQWKQLDEYIGQAVA